MQTFKMILYYNGIKNYEIYIEKN